MSMLLDAARRGLRAHRNGDRLVVRGPREEGQLAMKVLARKAEVVALLAAHPELANLDSLTAEVVQRFGGQILSEADVERDTPVDLPAVTIGEPARTRRCAGCGGASWWRLGAVDGPWICAMCHPPVVDEASVARVEVEP